MSLHHNQVERHVCPCELCELEFVVAFLKGANEENEACIASQFGAPNSPFHNIPMM